MNLKANTTFKHAGYTFIEGVVYSVDNTDAAYFIATKWMTKTKDKAVVTIAALGFDPDTIWAETNKKIMSG